MEAERVHRRGPRILLRDIVPDDLEALTRIWTDAAVMSPMLNEVMTPQECADVVARAERRARERPRRSYRLAVERWEDRTVIGTLGMTVDRYSSGYVHTGSILPETQRRGAGLEAFHLLCGLVFEDLGLHRIWSACDPDNTPVRQLFSKAGAVRVGTVPEYTFANGRWHDAVLYSLLERDWRAEHEKPAWPSPPAQAVPADR